MESHSRRAQAGFTLIELLTTLAILGLVAGAIASAFSSSLRVRAVLLDRGEQLEEVQAVTRMLRDDLEHLAPVPHALRVEAGSLSMLRRSQGNRLTIVRYRRESDAARSGQLLRESHELEPRSFLAWSEHSLEEGPGSAYPVHAWDSTAPIFRLPGSLNWTAMEYADGRWRPSDGDDSSAIRAVDLTIGAPGTASTSASRIRRGSRAPWTLRIALPMRLPEGSRS